MRQIRCGKLKHPTVDLVAVFGCVAGRVRKKIGAAYEQRSAAMPPSKARCIGILTSGGDCPGLNAAIRGVAKAADGFYGMEVLGILDGFTGLVENRVIHLGDRELSGLLTLGGTILGTSRNKPHRMP